MNLQVLNNIVLFSVACRKLIQNKLFRFKHLFKSVAFYFAFIFISSSAFADTPITLFDSYAGNVNYVGTQATRRTQSNTGDACAVLPAGTNNNASITGIPAGSSVVAAHLYWAGSHSTQAPSVLTAPDYTVTFEGNTVTAPGNRQYTSNFTAGAFDLDFFSGVADVTSIVSSRGNPNGSYSFSGLSTNNADPHCAPSAVTAGWSLIIVYEDTIEPLRVINLFEGFQDFRGNSINQTPFNFVIPNNGIDGKYSALTWEGDEGNSAVLNGFAEAHQFNGTVLSDGDNPINEQFNSVSTITSTPPSTGPAGTGNTSYGVDFDTYDISAQLSASDTTAATRYSSGGDLVLLSMQIVSVSNTPVSDVTLLKTASSEFNVGSNATYDITVTNNGPVDEPGDIVVTDTLAAGLTYVSGTGNGWICSAAGQDVTCTRASGLADGLSSSITLTVAVAAPALPSVSNTATVSGDNFDNIQSNNTSTVTTAVETPSLTIEKTQTGGANPIVTPSNIDYTIVITNDGSNNLTGVSVSDTLPDGTAGTLSAVTESGTADGIMNVGETFTYTISYPVTQDDIDTGTDLTNTASVVTDQLPTAEEDTAVTAITQTPSYNMVKTSDSPTISAPGTITYTFEFTNTGNVALSNLDISDPDATVAGCPIATLAVGATASCTGTRTITQAQIAAGADLPNTATPSVEDPSGATVPEDDTTDNSTNTEVLTADVFTTKTLVTPGPYTSGQIITYTITVGNSATSEGSATNVVVTDIPTNLTITSVSSTNCNSLPCTIPVLTVGATEVITVQATSP